MSGRRRCPATGKNRYLIWHRQRIAEPAGLAARAGTIFRPLFVTSRIASCVSSPKSDRRSDSQLGSSSRNPRVIQITVRRCELDQIALIGSAQAEPRAARKFGSGENDHALLDRSNFNRSISRQRQRGLRGQARRLRGRQRRLQERPAASQPRDRLQGDGQGAAQRRLRRRRGRQPHSRCHDCKAAGVRQEERRRRRRGVLLCRPRDRRERRQLPVAGRCRPEIRDGRQAGRGDQCRPHARSDHVGREGEARIPGRLPRQSVRSKDPLGQGHTAPSTSRPVLPR
ncbi:hypothetical protein ABIF67_002496 [Bradyrhizobium japonicum]